MKKLVNRTFYFNRDRKSFRKVMVTSFLTLSVLPVFSTLISSGFIDDYSQEHNFNVFGGSSQRRGSKKFRGSGLSATALVATLHEQITQSLVNVENKIEEIKKHFTSKNYFHALKRLDELFTILPEIEADIELLSTTAKQIPDPLISLSFLDKVIELELKLVNIRATASNLELQALEFKN